MLNFISVQTKCVHCGHDLMDKEHLIDNAASVKLYLRIGKQEGYIWLSSIYGSYNLESTFEIEPGEIAQFKCPHCFKELKSQETCTVCDAPLIDFHLLEGGKVSICSRAGCKKHSIEFEDLSTALNHFYNEYELQKHVHYDALEHLHKKPKVDSQPVKEVIETGSFLNAYCPHCKMNLIHENMIIFKIEKENGENGILYLSPYLNVFTHNTTIKIPEKAKAKDVKCIFCDHSLLHQEIKCPKCSSDIVRVNVSAMSRIIDFYFCSLKGCKWHGLSQEDLNFINLEDSQEW
ncbi:MAG: hypothetical protein U1C33_03820 [Candidatus Cloacimonadaceae bacterium]|nr:hypothetical protein [Candidatus Cloacimonadaceae bacterium]